MSLALANASKSNYFPFNDYFNIIFSKKGITEEDLSARPGWLVVFPPQAGKYISHSDHCGGLDSLIRTNQISEIVTPYQYIHQNTNTTQPNHHLLWTNMIVLRSEKSMSDLQLPGGITRSA